MRLQLIATALSQNRRIASRLRIIQHHRLLKQLEPINFLNSVRSRFYIVEDNECLALGFEVGFGDYLDDSAIFGEELFQGFLEVVNFDAFLEVADLYAISVNCFIWFSLVASRARRVGRRRGSGWKAHIDSAERSRLAHLLFPRFRQGT